MSTYRREACSTVRKAPTGIASKQPSNSLEIARPSVTQSSCMVESLKTINRASNSCNQKITYAEVLRCDVPVGAPSIPKKLVNKPTVAVVGCNPEISTLPNKILSEDCQKPKNLLHKSTSKVSVSKSSNQMPQSHFPEFSISKPKITTKRILYSPTAVQICPATIRHESKKLVSTIKKVVPLKRKKKHGNQKITKSKLRVYPQSSEEQVSTDHNSKLFATKIYEDATVDEPKATQSASKQLSLRKELKRLEPTISETDCEHDHYALSISTSSYSIDSKDDWLKPYQAYQAKWHKRRESRLKELHKFINDMKHINTEPHGVDSEMLQLIEDIHTLDIGERQRRYARPCFQPIEEPQHVALPPLTASQEIQIKNAMHGADDEVLCSKFGLDIKRRDIHTLFGLNWLNDEIINFYMNLLIQRSESQEATNRLPRVYAMNTFFVPRLLQFGYSGVQRWTRKVDIFTKDIIPVPVHMNDQHWGMAIIHLKQRYIKYYDSLSRTNSKILKALEQYLRRESMDKRNVSLDTHQFTIESVRNIPLQMNDSDCGVFSCMFAEYVTRNEPITFSQQHMSYFRKKIILEVIGGQLLS